MFVKYEIEIKLIIKLEDLINLAIAQLSSELPPRIVTFF
jgi:hypothetical protein